MRCWINCKQVSNLHCEHKIYVWADWATRVSCYIIYNPAGNIDLNSDWTAVPGATTTGQTEWAHQYSMWPLTFTFIVLWFFLVFFRNCLRLPDDMYSVMNITCGAADGRGKTVNYAQGEWQREEERPERINNHTRAWLSFMSSQYLWNLTMLGCSTCIRFSNISLIFS